MQDLQPKKNNEKIKLRTALQRLEWAKCRTNAKYNQALDIGIALEILLLSDLGPNEQISLTLKLRGAWLAGENAEDRQYICRILNEAYTIRSQVVHKGLSDKLKGHDPYANELSDHLRLLERIAKVCIMKGAPADWNKLLLGE